MRFTHAVATRSYHRVSLLMIAWCKCIIWKLQCVHIHCYNEAISGFNNDGALRWGAVEPFNVQRLATYCIDKKQWGLWLRIHAGRTNETQTGWCQQPLGCPMALNRPIHLNSRKENSPRMNGVDCCCGTIQVRAYKREDVCCCLRSTPWVNRWLKGEANIPWWRSVGLEWIG